jgi:glycine hydroxymethyltransferase
MGVFEFAGAGAETFLNAVTANDVSTLEIGEAHYSYLLGVDGIPLDDIYVYRCAADTFMMVVNASNNDKNFAWLNAVLAGEVQLDPQRPWVKAPMRDRVRFRDLRAASSGADRRVDIALQGPDSQKILLSLDSSAGDKAKLKGLKWSTLCQVKLAGFDLVISRTGYTGERTAYELFVHPDQAVALFKLLIERGAVPCGLAARDSLRTEAGLPLYGHELAGSLNMNPADAGFGAYVKIWKPFFVGKRAFIAYEAKRDVELVRFQIDSKGLRSPGAGDPIIDARGRVIGEVTSCALDSDGYQVGLALVKDKYAAEGTHFMVYAGTHGQDSGGAALGAVKIGDKVMAPQAATVISRSLKKKKQS